MASVIVKLLHVINFKLFPIPHDNQPGIHCSSGEGKNIATTIVPYQSVL